MIPAAFALLSTTQAPPNAAAIVSKMLAKYHQAQSLVGTIKFTQTAEGKSVSITTTLQYERPSKVAIRQVSSKQGTSEAFVVSDGKWFTYTLPPGMLRSSNDKALVEPMRRQGFTFDIGRVYITGSASLLDNSTPLAIAIGRMEDLKFMRGQWATVEYEGKGKVDGVDVDLIGGDWRAYAGVKTSGRYQIGVTAGGDLKKFSLRERVTPDPTIPPIEVVSVWTATLHPNQKPDARAFELPRA